MNTIQGKRPEALIFDMDGTLFRTETLLLPAYERTFQRLKEEELYTNETPPISIILSSLGMLLKDIWARVIPDADDTVRERADFLLIEEQVKLLEQGVGDMYPGVEATLRELHAAGFRLFVASNGLEEYVKGVAVHKGLEPLFEGLYSAGEYKTETKVDLVRMLLSNHNVASAWMVGDRSSDVEAGQGNGLPVVGCDYADFGVSTDELKGADVRIRSIAELRQLLRLG
jgi:phosphoglycolate phosphatase